MFIFVLDHSLANISCGSILFIFNVSGIEQKSDPRLLPSIFFFFFTLWYHALPTTSTTWLQYCICKSVYKDCLCKDCSEVCIRTVNNKALIAQSLSDFQFAGRIYQLPPCSLGTHSGGCAPSCEVKCGPGGNYPALLALRILHKAFPSSWQKSRCMFIAV